MNKDENEIDFASISQVARRIVDQYSDKIDFCDSRFVNIPIDLVEGYWEMKRILPLLEGLVERKTDSKDFNRTSELLIDNLWHLIDHLRDLDTALKAYDSTR